VLNGHKDVSEAFPDYLNSGKYSKIELYNTHVPRDKPQLIGEMVGENTLSIDNFAQFIEFIKKRYINIKAYNEKKVYDLELMEIESDFLKIEYITEAIAEYLKLGIVIN